MEWSYKNAMGPAPALVAKRSAGDYLAYAGPDLDDPTWTYIDRVSFDPALGGMAADGAQLRPLTLDAALAEVPPTHAEWMRGATAAVLDRQLERVGELTDELRAGVVDPHDAGHHSQLQQLADIAVAATSLLAQLRAASV